MNIFITAIGTDSGKTLVSAILCEALRADYWKPVQAGFPRDAETVQHLVSNRLTTIYPETYLLNTAASPHAAAKIDGVQIELNEFRLPASNHDLIIEGAGGCLVPLNDHDFVIDLAAHLKTDIILVADLYLGSINHTLLTADALKKRGLAVRGMIFNGDSNPESERIILHHTGFHPLLQIEREAEITPKIVMRYAEEFNRKRNG
jgi:dethiobiotin synthetase